jgi:hypothetical protein
MVTDDQCSCQRYGEAWHVYHLHGVLPDISAHVRHNVYNALTVLNTIELPCQFSRCGVMFFQNFNFLINYQLNCLTVENCIPWFPWLQHLNFGCDILYVPQ